MHPLLWFVLLIAAMVLIHLSVTLIMRRLDITPAAPEQRSRAFGDVIDRLRAASERRRLERGDQDDH